MTEGRCEQLLGDAARAHPRPDASVQRAGPASPHHHSAEARFAGGERPPAQEPARGSGARPGPDRPAARERRAGRCAADQPGTGPAERVAAAADGDPRRSRARAHARSTVMQAMYLVVAAVVGIQQPMARLQALLAAGGPAEIQRLTAAL